MVTSVGGTSDFSLLTIKEVILLVKVTAHHHLLFWDLTTIHMSRMHLQNNSNLQLTFHDRDLVYQIKNILKVTDS
jgi:hypothetical protein